MSLLDTDDEAISGCFDDLCGELFDVVDGHDAPDLAKQPFYKPEIPTGDADRGSHGFDIRVFVAIESDSESTPVLFKNEAYFIFAQWFEFVNKADAGIELRITGQPFFQPGHAQQDESKTITVVQITQLFE